jgi:hypothetical protein
MKQFTLRGDFDIGELTAVFEIPSSRWMELVRPLGWSNRPTEFSCFSDGVHPGWSSLGCGEATPAYRRRNQKLLCGATSPHQQFVLARFARPVIGRAFARRLARNHGNRCMPEALSLHADRATGLRRRAPLGCIASGPCRSANSSGLMSAAGLGGLNK